MSRKSLILCLVALAVLVAGTGLAVAFLYSGMEDDGKGKTSQVADEDRYLLFPAVPSDAVLVASFPKRDLAVSMHYSGKLTALYVYDAGKASEIPSDKAVSIMEDARAKGLVAEYVDCSQMEGVGGRLSGRALVVASVSDRLVESSVRHLSKSVSVLDAPGFADASKAALGSDLLFVSHAASANLVPVVMNKAYKGYAGFMSRLADWTVFNIDAADERFTLSGSAVYGGGASDFMTVLEQSVPSESSLSSVLPSYTRFAASLPLGDAGSYMQAYRQYLDSRNLLQKNASLKKALGSSTDSLNHAKRSVTLLLQLGRKAYVQAPTRDEDTLPWGDSRRTPRSMSALERNPQAPAPTPHKVLGSGIDGRGIPRGP